MACEFLQNCIESAGFHIACFPFVHRDFFQDTSLDETLQVAPGSFRRNLEPCRKFFYGEKKCRFPFQYLYNPDLTFVYVREPPERVEIILLLYLFVQI